MSLIADALRAAQEAKAGAGETERAATARRFLSSSASMGRRRDTVRWVPDSASETPRHLRVAAGAFVLAIAAAAGVVLLAPGSGAGIPEASALAATTAAPAGAAAAVLRTASPPPSAPVAAATMPGTAPNGVNGDGYVLEDAQADSGQRPAAAREPDPQRTASRGAAVAADAARAPLAAAPDPDLGRFQLRLQPPRAGSSADLQQALAAQRRRDFPSAVGLYLRALDEDPANIEALNNLGATYQAMGDLPRARDTFRRALAVQPGFAAAWSNLAIALGGLGESAEAQAALGEAIRLDPTNHSARVNLALQYQKQGLDAEAMRLLEQVVQGAPQLAEAHYALGRLLEATGDHAAAVRHYRLFLSTADARFPQLEGPVRQRIGQLGGGNVW